jgi:acetylornithine deacetylase
VIVPDELERRVLDAIASREDELVALLCDLIRLDTLAREPGDPPRQEAELQEGLAARLRGAGFAVELWEPDEAELAGAGNVPPGLDFAGRPQLAARLAGRGGGRSLLLNGHIDVVPADPVDRWTTPPFDPDVRDGAVWGRGASDDKGGVACLILAAETLARLGVPLAGELVVCTVTDEESSGAGSVAAARHGVAADAGLVCEPTGFETWVACRGGAGVEVLVSGRPGHAEKPQPHWRQGGAVNAIDRMQVVQDAVRRLREDWAGDPARSHLYLSPSSIVPVLIQGGEWSVSYPAECRLTCDVMYVPADQGRIRDEIAGAITAAAATDSWLAEHPPQVRFGVEVEPMEVAADHPFVAVLQGAAAAVERPATLAGLDSWFDAASFTAAGTPSVGWGPPSQAHTIDEHVPVAELVRVAQGIALAAMRWCGVAG